MTAIVKNRVYVIDLKRTFEVGEIIEAETETIQRLMRMGLVEKCPVNVDPPPTKAHKKKKEYE